MQEEILQELKNSGLFKGLEISNHCHGEDDCLAIEYYSDVPAEEKKFIKNLLRTSHPHWRIEKFDEYGSRMVIVFHERAKL